MLHLLRESVRGHQRIFQMIVVLIDKTIRLSQFYVHGHQRLFRSVYRFTRCSIAYIGRRPPPTQPNHTLSCLWTFVRDFKSQSCLFEGATMMPRRACLLSRQLEFTVDHITHRHKLMMANHFKLIDRLSHLQTPFIPILPPLLFVSASSSSVWTSYNG